MKVIKIYNQYRRDCHVDLKCEKCGHEKTITSAYDDRYYWDIVVPDMACSECGESTNSLGLEKLRIQTRYPEGYQI